jgi:ferredoxin-NADP reductase
MTTHATTLEAREEIAEGTMAFHLRKPGGFDFKTGQAIDVILTSSASAPEDQSTRHTFSIVSAPFQDDLVIATRMRDSAYKRALKSMTVGSQVTIDGPSGSLGLHKDPARAAILIAGGIGITPFMSMLRQAAKDQRPQRLILLYSNRRPEDAAFLAELQQLEAKNPNFKLVATMTEMQASHLPWDGQKGQVTEELVRGVVGDLVSPIFYAAGPPGMVEAIRQTLYGAGVDDDDIRSEEFYGY